MSNPLATSILSKLTQWYDFDGGFTDAIGGANLVPSVNPGFEAGHIGQSLKPIARASVAITAVPITSLGAKLTVGGWLKYATHVESTNGVFGLTASPANPSNEVLVVSVNRAYGFSVGGDPVFDAVDDKPSSLAYPITVQVHDSLGKSATSDQVIRIHAGSGVAPGWYFVVATIDGGTLRLYVNGELRATGFTNATIRTPITNIQVANTFIGSLTDAGIDACFMSTKGALSIDEIVWLYNLGVGRNYADVLAQA